MLLLYSSGQVLLSHWSKKDRLNAEVEKGNTYHDFLKEQKIEQNRKKKHLALAVSKAKDFRYLCDQSKTLKLNCPNIAVSFSLLKGFNQGDNSK